jgi:hypothetical protein
MSYFARQRPGVCLIGPSRSPSGLPEPISMRYSAVSSTYLLETARKLVNFTDDLLFDLRLIRTWQVVIDH